MYEKRLIATVVSIFTVGVAVGICLNNRITFAVCAIFAILAVASLIVISCLKSKGNTVSKRITATALAVAALLFGVLRISIDDIFSSNLEKYNKCQDVASVKIDEVNSKYIDGTILTSNCDVPKYTKVRLYTTYYNEELTNGDIIYCELKYSCDDSNQLKSKGINLTSSVNVTQIEKGKGLIYSIRNNVNQNNDRLFGNFDYAAEISKGVTIGDRSGMSSYIFALYRNLGVSHLLAISGLHVSIIVLSFYNLLVSLAVNRKVSNALSILATILFAALTGFSPGTLRSSMMISLVMALGMVLKKSDSITSLFLALMLFLLVNPYSICSLGLQLSFVCSLGILLISPLLEAVNFRISLKLVKSKLFKRLLYKLLLLMAIPLITSLVASVFSFPISFYSFNTTSAISPFANIIIIPIFTIAVELSAIAYLIAPLSLGLATLCSFPAGFIFQIVTEISKVVYNSNLGVISTRTPIMIIPLLCAFIGIIMIMAINRKRNLVALLSFSAFSFSVLFCGIINGFYEKDICVIEYGCDFGEYIFFSTEEGNMYLDMGGYQVDPEVVYETGSVYLENYVVSKYNARTYEHIDYMTAEIKVENIIMPNPKNEYDVIWLDKIKLLANERDCDIIHYSDDCQIKLSNDFETEIISNIKDGSKVETVYIKLGDYIIQFLCDGFSNNAVCDYAIVLDECKSDVKNIDAEDIYVQNGFLDYEEQKSYKLIRFDKKLKIEVNLEESDFRIYES